jgi:hypothetical protein
MGVVAEGVVSVAEVSVDAASPDKMVEVIRVGQGEAFEDSKVGLDEVEPGGLGGCEDGLDAETSKAAEP